MTNEVKLMFKEAFGIDAKDDSYIGFMGTPVVDPIVFGRGLYRTQFNDVESFEYFNLPVTSIVDFDRAKIQNATPIDEGRQGSVTESYGFENWQVTIRGFCLSDPAQKQGFVTAKLQEQQLVAWDGIMGPFDVFGSPFKIRKIDCLIITKITFDTLRGKPGVRPFTIHAIGEEPYELYL